MNIKIACYQTDKESINRIMVIQCKIIGCDQANAMFQVKHVAGIVIHKNDFPQRIIHNAIGHFNHLLGLSGAFHSTYKSDHTLHLHKYLVVRFYYNTTVPVFPPQHTKSEGKFPSPMGFIYFASSSDTKPGHSVPKAPAVLLPSLRSCGLLHTVRRCVCAFPKSQDAFYPKPCPVLS